MVMYRWRIWTGHRGGVEIVAIANDAEEARELASKELGIPHPKDCPENSGDPAWDRTVALLHEGLAAEPLTTTRPTCSAIWFSE